MYVQYLCTMSGRMEGWVCYHVGIDRSGVPMWTLRTIVLTVVIAVLAVLVLASQLDGLSKATALMSLTVALLLTLRRR